MIAVKAVHEGHNVKLPETFHISKPQSVIVTFLESETAGKEHIIDEISSLITNNNSFKFLDADEEDIYTDEDLKKRY